MSSNAPSFIHFSLSLSIYLRNGANQLTLGLVPRHLPMRILNLLPREDLLNENLERSILELGQRVLDQLIPQLALVLLIATAQPTALESRPLAKEQGHIRLLELGLQLGSRKRSQVDNNAILRNSPQVRRESFGSDEVDDDVDTLAVGGLEDFVSPVGLSRVEGCGCAELGGAEVRLLVAASGCVDG